ncbi:MAG: hypothetical protein HZA70_07735 [Planctomycetes bacterium]|nr:hypothetical protein [Planctomycetota bacterium]
MFNSLALPGTFCIKEEGKRIFVFKEGYKDLVVEWRETPPSCTAGRPEERGTAHRAPTAKWTVVPPGVLTVAPQTSKEEISSSVKVVKGRGEYPCVPLEGGGMAIIRRVRHGGLWGKVTGDLLWGVGRPVRELINANNALERGVPTAEILGIRLEAAGPLLTGPFYRAEVFSRELPETIDLLELLKSSESTLDVQQHKGEIIRAVALSVRAMHEAGLYHNDLHLKNILITKSASGGPFKAYIIDLDKSSLHESLSLNQRIKNLLRLDRSVEKFRTVGAYRNTPLRPITQRDKLRFLRDYMGGSHTWKEMARGWQGRSRYPGHTFHRWWWRVLGVMGIDPYGLRRNQEL